MEKKMVARKSRLSDLSERVFMTQTVTESGISRELSDKLDYLKDLGVDIVWISPMLPVSLLPIRDTTSLIITTSIRAFGNTG